MGLGQKYNRKSHINYKKKVAECPILMVIVLNENEIIGYDTMYYVISHIG